jgi:hypothetical protein
MGKLMIEGNCVYELDEECMKEKEKQKERAAQRTKRFSQGEKLVPNNNGSNRFKQL